MHDINLINRKGATKPADIPKEVKNLLELGELETVNLIECLAIDHKILLSNVLSVLNKKIYIDPCLHAIDNLKQKSITQTIIAIGKTLLEESQKKNDNYLFESISTHKSDSVRCWATYLIGLDANLTIGQKLEGIRKFAADSHFGVREIAWMAVRPTIDAHLEEAIFILSRWATDNDPNLRRFASESTRPRGVWCKHIERLKSEPQIALPILEPLMSEKEKYVRDSVANWLNDASKTRPDWVIEICEKWNKLSPTKETKKIIEKALRTIRKNNS